jgi:hypothetical protein
VADDEEPTPESEPEVAAEPKPDLRLRDLSAAQPCSVCGLIKEPHVRLEVHGRYEYTCKDCYEGGGPRRHACPNCGASLGAEDAFCGKCGSPAVLRCASCGAEHEKGDKFCGRCGTALPSAAT